MGSKRQPISGIAAYQPRPVISPQQNVQGNQLYTPPGGIQLRPFTPDPSLYTQQVAESMQNVANLQKAAMDNYNKSLMSQPQKTISTPVQLTLGQQRMNEAAARQGKPAKYPTTQETPAPVQYM
jgi:hypothetical protein